MPTSPRRNRRSPTIKDVAARAGVSWKTVTNVVHERQIVAAGTRARVLAAIDELGYRPGRAGRQLRQGHTDTLTLVVPELINPYFALLTDAVLLAAAERGFTVFVEQPGIDSERERRAAASVTRFDFDGVIFSPLYSSQSELTELAARLPVVLLGENMGDNAVDGVLTDNVTAATDVTAHVLGQGRRHPCFLGDQPLEPNETGRQRTNGFRRALENAGLEPHPTSFRPVVTYSQRQGAEAVTRLLAERVPVDALVCANDLLAIGAMHALRVAGVRVPEDIAVTGWDNVPDAAYLAPTLTTVEPHVDRIAVAAIERLIARIGGSEEPATRTVVPHDIVVRESTAPAA